MKHITPTILLIGLVFSINTNKITPFGNQQFKPGTDGNDQKSMISFWLTFHFQAKFMSVTGLNKDELRNYFTNLPYTLESIIIQSDRTPLNLLSHVVANDYAYPLDVTKMLVEEFKANVNSSFEIRIAAEGDPVKVNSVDIAALYGSLENLNYLISKGGKATDATKNYLRKNGTFYSKNNAEIMKTLGIPLSTSSSTPTGDSTTSSSKPEGLSTKLRKLKETLEKLKEKLS